MLRITGFPTTINRDLALVTATLNLCTIQIKIQKIKINISKILLVFVIALYEEEG